MAQDTKHKIPDREPIPLVMLPHNLRALLDNEIAVNSISLNWHTEFDNAVVLTVNMSEEQKAEAAKVGFRATTVRTVSGDDE